MMKNAKKSSSTIQEDSSDVGSSKSSGCDITASWQGKGGYFKDDRSLGGRGGRPNAVSISNNDVIV